MTKLIWEKEQEEELAHAIASANSEQEIVLARAVEKLQEELADTHRKHQAITQELLSYIYEYVNDKGSKPVNTLEPHIQVLISRLLKLTYKILKQHPAGWKQAVIELRQSNNTPR